jgi:hypothetical protein
MDHKDFFDQLGHIDICNNSAHCTYEELYQAIKSRLIEELAVIDSDLKLIRLIDTTSDEVKRKAESIIGTLEKPLEELIMSMYKPTNWPDSHGGSP